MKATAIYLPKASSLTIKIEGGEAEDAFWLISDSLNAAAEKGKDLPPSELCWKPEEIKKLSDTITKELE